MGLIFFDGFDAGDHRLRWTDTLGVWTQSTDTRFNTGRSLIYSDGTGRTLVKGISPLGTLYFGLAFKQIGSSNSTQPLVRLFGNNNVDDHVTIQLTGTYQLSVTTAGVLRTTTATNSVPIGAWNYLEGKVVISDTVGEVVLKLNGTTIVNLTGIDTKTGTTSTIDTFILGSPQGGGGNRYYDDVYLHDSAFLGDVRVHTIVPTGAGASTQFTPSTGANWAAVDELPYSATDYVTDSVVGHRDTYAMGDLPAGVSAVHGVQTCLIAKKTDAGALNVKPVVRQGGVNYYGTSVPLTASDATYIDLRTVDPATSAAWTPAGVNSIEAGVEVA